MTLDLETIKWLGEPVWSWVQLFFGPVIITTLGTTGVQWVIKQQEDRRKEREKDIEKMREEQAQLLANERYQQETFAKHLDQISTLVMEYGLRQAQPGDDVYTLAQARIGTALRELDGERQALLIQFIGRLVPLVSLAGKDGILNNSYLLSYANLKGIRLIHADLRNADLRGANLREANFNAARLEGARLENADLRDANFGAAKLQGAKLDGADLRGADLRNTKLIRASLRDADLRNARLCSANLDSADLTNADLSGADLTDAIVTPKQVKELAKNWEGAHYSEELRKELNSPVNKDAVIQP